MTTYTYAQLEGLWIKNGGSRATAPIAAAIAMAESGGDSEAESANPDGGTNVGFWQLDTPGGKGAGYSVGQLLNPATNAKVAIKGSNNGRDWSAWATWVSGAYKRFLSGSTTPDTNVPGSSSTTLASTAGTGAQTPGCLWSVQVPGGQAGSWLGGIVGAAGGQGAAGLVGPVTGTGGRICLFSAGEARALVGGLLMLGGAIMVLPGVLILAAFTFRAAGGGLGKAADVAAVVPGGQPVAAGLQAARNRAGRTGGQALTAQRASTP